jgi:hypothetical protein
MTFHHVSCEVVNRREIDQGQGLEVDVAGLPAETDGPLNRFGGGWQVLTKAEQARAYDPQASYPPTRRAQVAESGKRSPSDLQGLAVLPLDMRQPRLGG